MGLTTNKKTQLDLIIKELNFNLHMYVSKEKDKTKLARWIPFLRDAVSAYQEALYAFQKYLYQPERECLCTHCEVFTVVKRVEASAKAARLTHSEFLEDELTKEPISKSI